MIELPPLPWARDALTPHISVETIEHHYGKHHRGYVATLQRLIEGTPYARKNLDEIVRSAEGEVFDAAAQVWNHDFYWHSLRPGGGGQPRGMLGDAIQNDFGGYDQFRREFAHAAVSHFGSGWAWLVRANDGNHLAVRTTSNAGTPLTTGDKPLFTIDVWEHAYYLDHRSLRSRYIDVVLDHLVNWDFAANNLQENPMSRPHAEQPTQRNPDGLSEIELQHQRADSEGMAPRKQPEAEHAEKNEGEGNRTADRGYRQGIKAFLVGGRSKHAAERAVRAVDGAEGAVLRDAERVGKAGPRH